MTPKQIQALGLLTSSGKGATELANVLVSRQAPELLKLGLIKYNDKVWWGYSLTKEGLNAYNSQQRA